MEPSTSSSRLTFVTSAARAIATVFKIILAGLVVFANLVGWEPSAKNYIAQVIVVIRIPKAIVIRQLVSAFVKMDLLDLTAASTS